MAVADDIMLILVDAISQQATDQENVKTTRNQLYGVRTTGVRSTGDSIKTKANVVYDVVKDKLSGNK